MKKPQEIFNLLCQGDREKRLFLAGEIRKLKKDIPALLSVGRERATRKAKERRQIRDHLRWFWNHYPVTKLELKALGRKLKRETGFYPYGEWIDQIGLRSKRGAQFYVMVTIALNFKNFTPWALSGHLASLFEGLRIHNSKGQPFSQDAIYKIIKTNLLEK